MKRDVKKDGSTRKSDREVVKKKRTDAKDIFIAASKKDFTNPAEAGEFEIRYKNKWLKKPANQILHLLADRQNWPDALKATWTDEKTAQFLKWILRSHFGLLEVKSDKLMQQTSPLHMALMQNHTAFVNTVLEYPNLMNVANVLQETSIHQGNALHIAVRESFSSVELLVKKCSQYPGMFEEKDQMNGNTPLHTCMSLGWVGEAEEEEESDYSESEDDDYAETNSSSDGLADEAEEKGEDEGQYVNVQQGTPKEFSLRRTMSYKPPTNSANASKIAELVEVVKRLIHQHDCALWCRNSEGRTPYQERIHQLYRHRFGQDMSETERGTKEAETREQLFRTDVAEDPVASYVRSYCVRRFPRDTIMKCLYRTGEGLP